jgi:hypothetical protein
MPPKKCMNVMSESVKLMMSLISRLFAKSRIYVMACY